MTASEVFDWMILCKYDDWEHNMAQWMWVDTNFPDEEEFDLSNFKTKIIILPSGSWDRSVKSFGVEDELVLSRFSSLGTFFVTKF